MEIPPHSSVTNAPNQPFFKRLAARLRRASVRSVQGSPKRRHLLISGVGRSGTTFLVQLLTQLGFDTGYSDLTTHVFQNCHAGMEHDIHNEKAPYVIKNPGLCMYLDSFMENAGQNVIIDHLLVPVRDIYSAAESRRDVTRRTDPAVYPQGAPGGLWLTSDPTQQETMLQSMLYELIYGAARWEIPLTLLHFPRIVRDAPYLYRNLSPILKGMSYEEFNTGFSAVAKPQLVHQFSPAPQDGERS